MDGLQAERMTLGTEGMALDTMALGSQDTSAEPITRYTSSAYEAMSASPR